MSDEATVAGGTGDPHAPTPPLRLPSGELACAPVPAIMGIANLTPDSFADGGVAYPEGHPAAGLALARGLLAEGAAVIDVGGESTRPGATPVPTAEEIRRVVPVVEGLAADGAVVSVDTTKPEVARAAVAAGAQIVNDVAGGEPDLLEVVAETGAAYVLMHSRGTPATMRGLTDYDDVVAEVTAFLAEGLARCAAAGIDLERVAVDPGIGFAKTAEQSVALLRAVPGLRGLARPVLIGASRKSFLAALLDGAPVTERLEGSLAVAAVAAAQGAGILRVHDVAATVRAARVGAALGPRR